MKTIYFIFILLIIFSGCVPKINKSEIVSDEKIQIEIKKDLEEFSSNDIKLESNWWENFNDSQLNTIIEKALNEAPELKSLEARYNQANNLIKMHESRNLPSIGIGSGVSRQRFSENYIFPPPLGGGYYNLFDVGLGLDYDFDFWNARGSLISGVKNVALSQKAILKVKELSISTAIATLYIAWNFENKKIELLEDVKKVVSEKKDVLNNLFLQGLISKSLVNNQKVALEKIEQEVLNIDMRIDDIKKSLALVGGFLPSYIKSLKKPNIDEKLVSIPRDLHLDILSHRPDIAVQKYILMSKDSFIENAKAKFYPNISLSGILGFTSFEWSKLIDSSSFAPGIGLAFSLPIFDGGKRKANLAHNVDDYNAQVYTYNQTIISAVNEVSSTLKELELSKELIVSNEKEIKINSSNETIEKKRFEFGIENKMNYLDTKLVSLRSKLLNIGLKNKDLVLKIELIKSLGGGFELKEEKDGTNS